MNKWDDLGFFPPIFGNIQKLEDSLPRCAEGVFHFFVFFFHMFEGRTRQVFLWSLVKQGHVEGKAEDQQKS